MLKLYIPIINTLRTRTGDHILHHYYYYYYYQVGHAGDNIFGVR